MTGAIYECDDCGACCRGKLVDIFDEDVLREPRIKQAMKPLREPGLDGEIGYLYCLDSGACPFLDANDRCSIYPTRPVVCVLFPAGSDRCQAARRAFGLAPLEPLDPPAALPAGLATKPLN